MISRSRCSCFLHFRRSLSFGCYCRRLKACSFQTIFCSNNIYSAWLLHNILCWNIQERGFLTLWPRVSESCTTKPGLCMCANWKEISSLPPPIGCNPIANPPRLQQIYTITAFQYAHHAKSSDQGISTWITCSTSQGGYIIFQQIEIAAMHEWGHPQKCISLKTTLTSVPLQVYPVIGGVHIARNY